ncbi:FtsQ-family protein [Mycobacterium leprae Kyoto-2]|uniref:Cell division protein FtsQ n=3 Tax=Mycobacterium leprae TaxID=1769 RepID=FTSQ_MYCLB|nr:cell division protein FtsQ/DivIB [Mycobacterium leprae]B8ZQQ2.1 RecName: Full=Cell division protein FtsQ [Mycobacterium leprae Br4923]AWV47660.1 cell division protein FtsQ [Mycobacterium leprae]OAR21529.1 cell division protein FtsQ [Mycobacterium leprae 3125609]OAX71691.1 cell division protein FtsQ [Mycobacterium leprae 7935681]CAC31297.1 putative FtsQ-family protein [Mycobacterium leprae]CAR71011.1 putative FtsQ-family protein [Mycobacterium leprae Br4923]
MTETDEGAPVNHSATMWAVVGVPPVCGGQPGDSGVVAGTSRALVDAAIIAPVTTLTRDEPAQYDRYEFEGPRRRARRERAERRAAQACAIAIEEARREAKHRIHRQMSSEANSPKPVARGVVRGLKTLFATVMFSIAGFGLGLALYVTPAMSVRNIVVTGIETVTREEVLDAAGVQLGTPLLQINTNQVADQVAAIRRVASARAQRQYPSALRITIVERVPVVVKDFPDGPHLFDCDGVDFATAPPPPALPYIDVGHPGPIDPATKAALVVLLALRPEVVSQVARIAAPSVSSITLILTDGRAVIWGSTDRAEEKAEKLAALLTQPGRTYDVSSPDLPTVK